MRRSWRGGEGMRGVVGDGKERGDRRGRCSMGGEGEGQSEGKLLEGR